MRLRITIDGRVYEATVEVLEEERQPVAAPAPAPQGPAAPVGAAPAAREARAAAEGGDGRAVRAALPGVISDVRVVPGQRVQAGDVLLVLEAMKMDNDITAPVAGTVRTVPVARGQRVAAQQVLVILDA